MRIKIKETGEVKELNIFDKNGINWTNDLILGVEEVRYNRETEMYEMEQEQYDWWKEYIENFEADEEKASILAGELEIDESEIWDRYNSYHTTDYCDHHGIKQTIFKEMREEYKK